MAPCPLFQHSRFRHRGRPVPSLPCCEERNSECIVAGGFNIEAGQVESLCPDCRKGEGRPWGVTRELGCHTAGVSHENSRVFTI